MYRIIKVVVQSVCIVSVGCGCLLPVGQAVAADAGASAVAVLDEGFGLWGKRGVAFALDVWQKGGLMEGDNKVAAQSNFFRRLDRTAGGYRSYELLETKRIGQSSEIIYIAINFEHGAVYARFLLYRAEKEWVVQNMDFSPKPEAVMPWLAFGGVSYAD
jgi:hypothetical protein